MTQKEAFVELPAAIVKYPVKEIISGIIRSAQQLDLPFALYRLPDEVSASLMLQLESTVCHQPLALEQTPRGFAVNRFLPESGGTALITAELEFSIGSGGGITFRATKQDLWLSRFFSTLEKQLSERLPVEAGFNPTEQIPETELKAQFEELVSKAVKGIGKNKFKKVVLSRRKSITLPEGFDTLAAWQKLCELYPQSFVSLFSLPGKGTWLGATPEVLLNVEPGQKVSTMALAGTKAVSEISPTIKWGDKELEEQALVSRFIQECFELLGIEGYKQGKTVTIQAGPLLHLSTEFQYDLAGKADRPIATRLLELLHPTPAVCGTPRNEALDFLLREEGYDRELYSGFIGPVDRQTGSQLFVNLRCMQLFDKNAWLYVGAGITADSDPEKEWLETEMKSQVLLNAL